MKIDEVEGIGATYAAKLADAGVSTTEALLDRGGKPSGRKSLEDGTGISGKLLLEWVNHVDLMRIKGVGSEYSDLLEAAGVDSPAELANRNAANLAITFQEVVAARPGIVRRIPSEDEVNGWIAASKDLPKLVEH
jgi:predicted flap endonuclease-1-like 5' DNA nuclease